MQWQLSAHISHVSSFANLHRTPSTSLGILTVLQPLTPLPTLIPPLVTTVAQLPSCQLILVWVGSAITSLMLLPPHSVVPLLTSLSLYLPPTFLEMDQHQIQLLVVRMHNNRLIHLLIMCSL